MKILSLGILALSVLAGMLLLERTSSGGGQALKIRPMAVAGSFYPADPQELGKMIDGFLAKAAPAPVENLVALVAPHAGYIYSGPVAAWSYALLKGRKYDRVVVIAPSHYEAFEFASVYDGAAYTTPFGQIPVDQAFAARLARMSPAIKLSGMGHTPSKQQPEHAIEVQLPFLQRTIGPFQLVPIILGDQSYETSRALGVALARLARGANTLIVASSDLSHYHPYDEASRMDRKTLQGIGEYDYFNLARNLAARVWEACGGGPIVAAMVAAERLGANQARVLHYANTGDVTGDRGRVVGYGAVALVKSAGGKEKEASFSLTRAEMDALLTIARRSVESAVRGSKPFEASAGGLDALTRERGAFVTLTERGQLRGCIGYVAPLKPLYLTVLNVAALAALHDTRFRPVAPAELPDLEYEISVLSPLRRVLDIQEIRVGMHGLLIHGGGHEGLLLPQVASEQKWDTAAFVEQVCLKAGLPRGSWRGPAYDLFRFTALVFGDRRHGASLLRIPAPPGTPAWNSPTRPARPS